MSRASSPYLNCVGWQDMRLTEMMKCRASYPCLNCVGWQDISLTEGRASSPCLDCVGWQDMRLVSGRASSPCLNCMGWQDTSLTVAKEDRASSPYLNCIGWQDKSSSRWSFPGVLPLGQDKLTVEVKNHNALWSASETSHHSNAAELTSFSYCFVMVAWSIESRKNQKMVIVGVRLVSKFLPTMTLYCTIILDYCRVQLKK